MSRDESYRQIILAFFAIKIITTMIIWKGNYYPAAKGRQRGAAEGGDFACSRQVWKFPLAENSTP